MSTAELAGIIAALVTTLIMCFQLLLAIGIPFAEAAWGGRQTSPLRAASSGL